MPVMMVTAVMITQEAAPPNPTSAFFRKMVEEKRLGMLLDFENRKAHFAGIHRSFKYSLLSLAGKPGDCPSIDCAFFLHGPEDMADPERRFPLQPEDFARFNPNTLTSPIFRTRRDAEITRTLYEGKMVQH